MLVSIGQPSKLAPISLVGSAPTLRFGRLKYESWFGDFLSLLNHVERFPVGSSSPSWELAESQDWHKNVNHVGGKRGKSVEQCDVIFPRAGVANSVPEGLPSCRLQI